MRASDSMSRKKSPASDLRVEPSLTLDQEAESAKPAAPGDPAHEASKRPASSPQTAAVIAIIGFAIFCVGGAAIYVSIKDGQPKPIHLFGVLGLGFILAVSWVLASALLNGKLPKAVAAAGAALVAAMFAALTGIIHDVNLKTIEEMVKGGNPPDKFEERSKEAAKPPVVAKVDRVHMGNASSSHRPGPVASAATAAKSASATAGNARTGVDVASVVRNLAEDPTRIAQPAGEQTKPVEAPTPTTPAGVAATITHEGSPSEVTIRVTGVDILRSKLTYRIGRFYANLWDVVDGAVQVVKPVKPGDTIEVWNDGEVIATWQDTRPRPETAPSADEESSDAARARSPASDQRDTDGEDVPKEVSPSA
jgi:hypothetical protein